MPRLEEVIGSSESLHQHRGLMILQQVVKTLASKRLRNDRRVFKVNIFVHSAMCRNLYIDHFCFVSFRTSVTSYIHAFSNYGINTHNHSFKV